MTATDLPPRLAKFKPSASALTGELLTPAEYDGLIANLRGGLTAAYTHAGATGARRIQLQILSGLGALRILSRGRAA